jgi:hypothetical protein
MRLSSLKSTISKDELGGISTETHLDNVTSHLFRIVTAEKFNGFSSFAYLENSNFNSQFFMSNISSHIHLNDLGVRYIFWDTSESLEGDSDGTFTPESLGGDSGGALLGGDLDDTFK